MSEFLRFLRLYADEDAFLAGGIGLSMALLYGSAALYIADLYRMMKRKTQAETVAVLLSPGVIAVIGSALAAILVHVPDPRRLAASSEYRFRELVELTREREINRALLVVCAVYLALFGIGAWIQRGRERRDRRGWLLSCLPDLAYLAVLLAGVCANLAFAQEGGIWSARFGSARWGFARVWLYGIYLLLCKELLLAAGYLAELALLRIPLRFRAGGNASRFLAFYYLVCQNALLRGALLAEAMLIVPLSAVVISELARGNAPELGALGMIAFFWLGALLVILVSIGPVMRLLARFGSWGDARERKEEFCREYFLEEPAFRNRFYAVTRHYLVDERAAATVYYLPFLAGVSGWQLTPKGELRELRFRDGQLCQISAEEREVSEEVFRIAQERIAEARSMAGMEPDKGTDAGNPRGNAVYGAAAGADPGWNALRDPAQTTYQRVLKVVAFILLFALFAAGAGVNLR